MLTIKVSINSTCKGRERSVFFLRIMLACTLHAGFCDRTTGLHP
jgi:hypothetical protein